MEGKGTCESWGKRKGRDGFLFSGGLNTNLEFSRRFSGTRLHRNFRIKSNPFFSESSMSNDDCVLLR